MELEHGASELSAHIEPGLLRALRLSQRRTISHFRHRGSRNNIQREEFRGGDLHGLTSDIVYLVSKDGVGYGWVRVGRERLGWGWG